MSVIKMLSDADADAAAKRTRTALLLLSLLTLIWRLSDLIEEAITGTPKMSMGTWLITGGDAVVVQIVIVGTLGCIVFTAYSHMRQESTSGSKAP
jgi:hypothetical protein